MSVAFEFNAETRSDVGKGASRRLRREGKVPAVLYGAGQPAEALTLEQNDVVKKLENEGVYSHVLTIRIGDRSESAILRDLQRHPYKPLINHMDFQRVSADEKIRVHVPLHFINEETSRGVKQQGGVVSHLLIEVEVQCLPRDLPEFIEVDLVNLELGQTLHLSELSLPPGVELASGATGDHDTAVANIHHARTAAAEEAAGEEEGGEQD